MATSLSNKIIMFLLYSPLHFLVGNNFAVINIKGIRTGIPIQTPINVMVVDDKLMVISMRHRTWWRNLRGGNAADLRFRGKSLSVRGEVIEELDEVRIGLNNYFSHYPAMKKYFHIKSDPNGNINSSDLTQIAKDRVIVCFSEELTLVE